jgi:hypothetical protein
VAHIGEEFGLGAVRGLGGLLCFDELSVDQFALDRVAD